MHVQKLPVEIIQNIFEFIDTNDLYYDLLYVCKKWYPLIRSIYFESITWKGKEKLQRLKKQLSIIKEIDNDTQIFQPLLMTRRLCIQDEYDADDNDNEHTSTQLTEGEFIYVLSLFPNLQYLEIQYSEHRVHYMQSLCHNREPEKLPLLEDINFGTTHSGDQDLRVLCFATHYLFKRSLKTITIIYANSLNEGGRFIKSLLDFKNLRELNISNDSESDLTLFHLLQGCPNLSHLWYESTCPIPESATHQLTSILQNLANQRLSMSQFLKNLKSLELHFPEPEASYIDFFANHCPQSLENITLYLTKTGRCFWNHERKADLILGFCKSLQKFDMVHLMMGENDGPTMLNEKINFFYQILNAITGKKEFFKSSAGYTYGYNDDVSIRINGIELVYQCYVEFDFTEEHCPPAPSDLTHLAKVNNFVLDNGYNKFNSFPTYYLKYVQRYCPQLTQFRIQGELNGLRYNYNRNNCCFIAECLDPYTTSMENMKSIMINGFDYSQELIDGLIEYFPRVEVLSITAIESLKGERIMFKLSKFKYLHTFIVDFHCDSESEEGICFLEYTDSKRSIQYSIDKWNSGDVVASQIKFISADTMQRGIIKNEKANFAFYVKSFDQLTKIEVKKNESAYATLDLS